MTAAATGVQLVRDGGACDSNGVCWSTCCSLRQNVCISNESSSFVADNATVACLVDPPTATNPSYAPDVSQNETFYISVGVGAAVSIAVLVVFLWRATRAAATDKHVDMSSTDVATIHGSDRPPVRLQRHGATALTFSDADKQILDPYRLDSSKLELKVLLATGGYGTVWRGQYDGAVVAVKVLFDGRKSAAGVSKFIAEVALLATLVNPYVVSFVGASWTTVESLALVVEYMDLGDLYDYLRTHSAVEFSWTAKRRCAADIVRGLVYLHDRNIIHRDVKSRNVLLDTVKPSKLSDFGVSREISSKTMSQEVGTYLWTAPEILRGDRYTVSADIYSLGVLLGELDSHQPPFYNVTIEDGGPMLGVSIMMRVMQNQLHVDVSPQCPPRIASLIDLCTGHGPAQRPTAAQVLGALEAWVVDTVRGNDLDLCRT
ncbi:TKL protein kinase [Aphanomyces invadans]|uniref:TKL protein kinase n=1 Tax=Aphanomyces invadans TaxID=157072 RepID=A0A024TH65_9STRA|nr:TKL protein kinase [Aphanomyces invadans]ETV93344.1 TKL protein kinase [Aphanomyces invadans]|eukprot:XP_008877980.1 TKL protein kinase [Aphanomyces invadans]